jgi:hypothetical protein
MKQEPCPTRNDHPPVKRAVDAEATQSPDRINGRSLAAVRLSPATLIDNILVDAPKNWYIILQSALVSRRWEYGLLVTTHGS